MEKQDSNSYDKSYHPPETIKIEYCAAVLGVVFRHHSKAKELFQNIRHYASLPGVQDTFSFLERKIPDGSQILTGIVKDSGYDKHSKPEDNPAMSARKLIVGTRIFIVNLTKKFMFWIKLNRKRRNDLNVLARSIDNFIRVCFNPESAKNAGNYRITGENSKILLSLITLRALLDTNEKYEQLFKRLGKIPMHRNGKKAYSIEAVLDGKMPALAKRSLVSNYLKAGFKLKHTSVIETTAWRWYQCRVVHDGPTEYYREQLRQTTPEDRVVIDPENLLHEIAEFDKALGYTREETGKRKS
jgi:hypothetical protein